MKKLIISTIISLSIFAENNPPVVLDPHLSPYVGADDLILAHRILEDSHLTHLGKPIFSQNQTLEKIGRFAELYFFWNPINYTAMVTQHEVFGHGYRVRSIRDKGAEVLEYKIGVPPPYGPGGGHTQYSFLLQDTSVFQLSGIKSGGVEATSILANRVRLQWLKEQTISPAQASLYRHAQEDIFDYVLNTHHADGGDIYKYVELLNRTYGEKFTIHDLKKQVYWNLLDPFIYYSWYSDFTYILKGTKTSIPMIPIGSYKYLPAFRMGLTPFGPEHYLENFLVKGDAPIYFYLRNGSFASNRYMGFGVEDPYVWKFDTWSLGFRADVWLQPAVSFNSTRYSATQFAQPSWKPVHIKDSRLGTSLSLICQKELWENGSMFLQVGGKSQGYVPGEELSSGLIFRVGITLW